jgi:hypothetical protein
MLDYKLSPEMQKRKIQTTKLQKLMILALKEAQARNQKK